MRSMSNRIGRVASIATLSLAWSACGGNAFAILVLATESGQFGTNGHVFVVSTHGTNVTVTGQACVNPLSTQRRRNTRLPLAPTTFCSMANDLKFAAARFMRLVSSASIGGIVCKWRGPWG